MLLVSSNRLNKADYLVSDKELLLILKREAQDQLNLRNNKGIKRFFNSPPTDEFEIRFYEIIRHAEDLKTIVNWIDEVKNSGLAYKKTRKMHIE